MKDASKDKTSEWPLIITAAATAVAFAFQMNLTVKIVTTVSFMVIVGIRTINVWRERRA